MKQTYSKRIEALEAQAGAKVCGIVYTNPQAYNDPIARAGLVRLSGCDAAMTIAEFEDRYPTGTLIRMTYTTEWRPCAQH